MAIHDPFEYFLPLDQRDRPEILVFMAQTIEGVEHWRAATAERLIEPGASVLVQRYDFTVQNQRAAQ
jgi:hypothetical protein